MGLGELNEVDRALAAEVADWRRRGLGRSVGGGGTDGRVAVDFTSNDYLGMAGNAAVCAAASEAAREHGAGGRAARLLGGGSPKTADLEHQLASWLGADAALLLPSGYQANLTLMAAIAGPGDVVVSDEDNHASLIDGLRLSRATVKVFRHADAEHAAALLEESRGARRVLCVTESVFSMGGDRAPLVELSEACARLGAGLIVDEAHAVGVVGPRGRGGFAASGAASAPLVAQIVTGGKALGAAGAFIAGSQALVEAVIHKGRGFMFSTAVAPAVVGALEASIGLVADADPAREILRAHAVRIAAAAGAPEPSAAIVPILIGDERRAVAAAEALRAGGLGVRAVRQPTVRPGAAQLRVACHAQHQSQDIDALLDGLAPILGAGDGTVRAGDTDGAQRAVETVSSPSSLTVPPPPVFIVGTDTDIGKTVAAAAVARALDAPYWKPVQTGEDSDSRTVERLAGPRPDAARVIAAPAYEFPLPASPHTAAAAAGAVIDPEVLHVALGDRVREAAPAPLVVELAGGLHVPLTASYTQADWLARERPRVVLIARSGLGTLNHTLLTLEALRARRLTPSALILVGEPHAENAATLAAHVDHLFELPTLAPLDPGAIDAWLAEHPLADAIRRE